MKIPEQMIRAQLKEMRAQLDEYNSQVEQLDDSSSNSPFKVWASTITEDENVLINDVVDFVQSNKEFTPEQIKGMMTVVNTVRDKLVDMFQTQYFATLPIRPTATDESELTKQHAELKANWKMIQEMVKSGWTTQNLVDEILPIEYKKVGRATSEIPTLKLLKPPSQQIRSNSKQMRLFVDGNLVEAENLSKAILEALNMDYKDFRDQIGGDYVEGKVHEIKGHKVEIRYFQK